MLRDGSMVEGAHLVSSETMSGTPIASITFAEDNCPIGETPTVGQGPETSRRMNDGFLTSGIGIVRRRLLPKVPDMASA